MNSKKWHKSFTKLKKRVITITYLQQREAELTSQLTQTDAELRAAMDGLREARLEAEELRAYIEKISHPKSDLPT